MQKRLNLQVSLERGVACPERGAAHLNELFVKKRGTLRLIFAQGEVFRPSEKRFFAQERVFSLKGK